ncbi:MAG: NFACT RNA binding domain-containing protein [Candidatus Cloacimonadaceae bacterium]
MKYTFLAAWTAELQGFKAQIDRILLTEDSLIIRLIRRGEFTIVLNPQNSYIFYSKDNKKHDEAHEIWQNLRNCQIVDLDIYDSDRIIFFELLQRNIYGEEKNITLLLELMPPKPNVIVINKETNIIIDALIKYNLSDNPMRMVLANQPYFAPKTSFTPDRNEKAIIPESFEASSINEYFSLYHKQILVPKLEKDLTESKIKFLQKELKRHKNRLKMQKKDLEKAEKADYYFACAEAIKPNMQKMKQGDEVLITTNYYDPELNEIEVPLLTDKSPLQNLQHYLKRYRKAKNGYAIIQQNIKKTKSEIESLEKLVARLQDGEDIDIDIRDRGTSITQKIKQIDRILQLKYDDDWQIYIGRKAKENDFITTKLGKAQDWWFHSRIYRGAHVLARNLKKKTPPLELIQICCALAAWYSQAKFSVNVPVDYTQIRYVRKPKGSPSGFVTYTNYKTVFANPKDLRTIKKDLGHD